MIYTKTVTEAAGGSAASPTQSKMIVPAGLIYQFELYLPPGSSGLLHVWVKDGGYHLYPAEPGETFFGDNTLVTYNDLYYVASPNHTLDIYSYNLDEAFEHIFQIRLGVVLDPVMMSHYLPALTMGGFEETIAEVLASQDYSREAQRERSIAKYVDQGLPPPPEFNGGDV